MTGCRRHRSTNSPEKHLQSQRLNCPFPLRCQAFARLCLHCFDSPYMGRRCWVTRTPIALDSADAQLISSAADHRSGVVVLCGCRFAVAGPGPYRAAHLSGSHRSLGDGGRRRATRGRQWGKREHRRGDWTVVGHVRRGGGRCHRHVGGRCRGLRDRWSVRPGDCEYWGGFDGSGSAAPCPQGGRFCGAQVNMRVDRGGSRHRSRHGTSNSGR